MVEATLRPWKLVYNGDVLEDIVGSNGKSIAELSIEESSANARLIVKAVNCHDEMVEICDRLVCDLILTGKTLTETEMLLLEKAKQALKKVESEGLHE